MSHDLFYFCGAKKNKAKKIIITLVALRVSRAIIINRLDMGTNTFSRCYARFIESYVKRKRKLLHLCCYCYCCYFHLIWQRMRIPAQCVSRMFAGTLFEHTESNQHAHFILSLNMSDEPGIGLSTYQPIRIRTITTSDRRQAIVIAGAHITLSRNVPA